MKIEVDVIGVEQACDFTTMQTAAFVVLDLFGEVLRVPISEDQMERFTLAATNQTAMVAGETFEETRDTLSVPLPPTRQERLADAPVRDFSVMEGLGDFPVANSEPAGMESIFGGEDEQEKIERLRQRQPPARDVDMSPGIPTIASSRPTDDDFPQG